MSRRKAIERAVEAGWKEYSEGNHGTIGGAISALGRVSAGYAYDEGRIAGLREAASFCWSPQEKLLQRFLRKRADKLAKKARKR